MRRNETDANRRRLPITLMNPDETPYTGDLDDPDVRHHIPGTTTWAAVTSSTLTALTGGPDATFYVQLTEAETSVSGLHRLSVEVGTAVPFEALFEIDEIETGATEIVDAVNEAVTEITEAVTDLGATVANGILNTVTYGARTFRGVLRRLDALVTGKAIGLNDAAVTIYLEDGITPAFTFSQNTTNGTRDAATVVDGDD